MRTITTDREGALMAGDVLVKLRVGFSITPAEHFNSIVAVVADDKTARAALDVIEALHPANKE